MLILLLKVLEKHLCTMQLEKVTRKLPNFLL